MATIAIPESVQAYFPFTIDPAHLWVNYSQRADSLTIYFAGEPTPSVWEDVDQYAYVGFAQDDETKVTGLMIEHFSKWLLVKGSAERQLQLA